MIQIYRIIMIFGKRYCKYFLCLVSITVLIVIIFFDSRGNIKNPQFWRKETSMMDMDVKVSDIGNLATSLPLKFQKHGYEETPISMTIYDRRKLQLQRACSNNVRGFIGHSKDNEVMHNLHVDRYHKLLYCQVQKVASTFVRKLLDRLKSLKGTGRKHVKPSVERLLVLNKNLTFTAVHSILSGSQKFIFVREPYSRLWSGYVDKLFAANPLYWGYVGKYTVSLVRKNPSETSRKCGHDVTFPEFVRYMIFTAKTGKHTDRHFTPMYEHCRPCHINYDFIGKMETFKEDMSHLINSWNKKYRVNLNFKDFEGESDLQIARSHVQRIYGMKKDIIKCISFYSALWRTWRDLQIRGIIPIRIDMPFTEEQSKVLKSTEFFYEIKKVIENVKDRAKIKQQRQKALLEAYNMIPLQDMMKLKKILEPDCKLFGYDCRPPKLFLNRRTGKRKLKYFNRLS